MRVLPLPRSIAAFAALALGFVVARGAPGVPAAAWFSVAAGAAAAALLVKGRVCRGALVVAALCFGAGWFAARVHDVGRGSLAGYLPTGESVVTVEGVVLESPRQAASLRDPLNPHVIGGPRVRFELGVTGLHTDAGVLGASGTVRVRAGLPAVEAGIGQIHAGDRVRLTGVFAPVDRPLNPGEYDRRLWAAQEGVAGTLSLPTLEYEAAETKGAAEEIWSAWLGFRGWASDRAERLLLGDKNGGDGRGRALLAALVLGQEEPALREVRGAFNRLGLAHVLSISGFHMAVLAMVGLAALRATGDLGRWEPILIAGLVLLYLAILPFNAPAWRSGLMVLGLLIGDALGRRYDRLATLGWIAVLLLIWRPMDLWSAGFQLSFGLVAALIRLGEPAHGRIFGVPLKGTLVREPGLLGMGADWSKRLLSTNLLCWALASPLVAYHTGLVSPIAVLTGVVVVPLITLVLIGSYAAVAIGILVPAASPTAGAVIERLASWTAAVVGWIDAAPGTSLRLPVLSVAWTAAATGVVLFWFLRGRWRSRAAWGLTAAIALWTSAEMFLGPRLPASVRVRVDTLAVGDGTCMLLRSGGDAVLWDCGSLTPGVGQLLVPRATRALGAWRVPTVVITHPNLDHFNGVLDIVEPLGVREVVIGESFERRAVQRPGGPEAYLLTELAARGVTVRTAAAGDTIPLGGTRISFLSPPPGARWPLENDLSLVAAVGGTARGPLPLLLTGDVQDQGIASVMAAHAGLSPRVMEAPHHGSVRPAAMEFAVWANPEVVLQSTGPGRAGDPRWDGARAGRTWLCTATDGAVWVEVRDAGVRVGAGR